MTLGNGKKLIKYKNYTYYNIGKYKATMNYQWACTNKKCVAYILVSPDLDIKKQVKDHDHRPPKYMKNGNVYVAMDWYEKWWKKWSCIWFLIIYLKLIYGVFSCSLYVGHRESLSSSISFDFHFYINVYINIIINQLFNKINICIFIGILFIVFHFDLWLTRLRSMVSFRLYKQTFKLFANHYSTTPKLF